MNRLQEKLKQSSEINLMYNEMCLFSNVLIKFDFGQLYLILSLQLT